MHTLDLETSPTVGDLSNGYALEPWRVRQGKAYISSCAVLSDDGYKTNLLRPSKSQLYEELEKLAGKEVYCHNAVFDIAWCIATLNDDKTKPVPQVIRNIKWRDTMLLCKWIVNGQAAEDSRFSYSLVNLIKAYLMESPGSAEFIAMKERVELDSTNPYWLERGMMDCIKTMELAKFLEPHLKPEQRRGFLIEQKNLPFIANSWLVGVRVDENKLLEAEQFYLTERVRFIKETGLNISLEVLNSPAQLGHLVYNDLGLPIIEKTPTGKPSTSADTMKLLAYKTNDERLKKIVQAKECSTILSKYVDTAKMALERTRDGYMYGVPKIFGANTGRFTMSNETLKDQKVSIAMHQIPRKAPKIRAYMLPPPGMKLMEADAMAQESRIMAIWSRDENMINIFKQGIDPHAWMAGEVYGKPWQTIVEGKNKGDLAMIEMRQNGKLINLSSNFRIGGKSLAKKSFTEYDKWMSEEDGYYMGNVFKKAYPGVPRYWDSIISFARANGYTYTLAQRRFKISKWEGRDKWGSEGIAISHPIQGTAGDHLHATMTACHDHVMLTTLHDATFFAVKDDKEGDEIAAKMNSVNYSEMWNVPLPIDLPFEHHVGNSFADVK